MKIFLFLLVSTLYINSLVKARPNIQRLITDSLKRAGLKTQELKKSVNDFGGPSSNLDNNFQNYVFEDMNQLNNIVDDLEKIIAINRKLQGECSIVLVNHAFLAFIF